MGKEDKKDKKEKKEKKKLKKHRKNKHKDKKKDLEKLGKDSKIYKKVYHSSEQTITSGPASCSQIVASSRSSATITNEEPTTDAPRATRIPMTKAQYELEQSVVREVYDSQTNRVRLIKGSGEVIERIVSRSEHQAINACATLGDGASFLASSLLKAQSSKYS